MSWDSYIPNLCGYANVNFAAIVGLDGNPWCSSANFSVKPEEAKALVGPLSNPQGPPPTSFFINGEKYFTLRVFDNTIDGKGKDHPGNAVTVSKSDKALVVAAHVDQPNDKPKEGMSQCTNKAAVTVRDYLKSIQY